MGLSLARVLRGSLSGFLVLSRAASGGAIGALLGLLITGDGARVSEPVVIALAIVGTVIATSLVGWRGHGGKRGLPRAFAIVVLAVVTFYVTFMAAGTALPLAHAWKVAIAAGVAVAAILGVWLLEPPPKSESP